MDHGATGLRLISASTGHLREQDKFAFWNEVICRTVVDLECRPVEQPFFDASIGGFDAPGLGVYDIHTHAHLVYRDKTQIARLDGDALIINYVTSGQLHSEQDGRAVRLEVGDGAVSDAARPYFLQFDRPLGCVSVKVYKSDLASRVIGIERISATSLRQRSTLTPLVVDYMKQLIATAPTLGHAAGLEAAAVFKDLLAASLSEVVLGTPTSASEGRSVTLLRVKAYVEEQLADPNLDPGQVARALGLSTRYVSHLFQSEQTSLMRYIWQRRLEWCARRISGLSASRQSLTDIAFAVGFNDLSHFSRSFKARFGMSPRAFREQARRRVDLSGETPIGIDASAAGNRMSRSNSEPAPRE